MDIEGLSINYIVEGQGRDVLVLHGWGANINTVLPIVNILKNKFRVHALDLPGFGKSEEPKKPIDSFKYAEIVKNYMDNMGIKKVVLIGHSFGGKLSIILGSKYPEIVDKIVLVNSAGLIPKRGPKYYIKVYTFKAAKLLYKILFFWLKNEEKMEKFYKKFGSTDYKASSGVMRNILVTVVNENLLPLLNKIEAPTLLIWGDKDTATPLYMGKIMESQIKDSGLVVLEGTGHYSYLEDYQRFTVILRSFLQYDKE
ncbi:alpha/beta fold hydrolase [Tissierella praeacuta]|uniref:alpha/beta fold hydrolase n=1 Tax=Tissierella praeacuta TaxID=43131 RepID=UPI000E063BB0|nr:alpha/beta hydrolase [Tissierella praeacuta]MBU5256642.1 alpha/beta hydrolase [Tissierella praeacuta]SUP00358.1 2-hydroxy-6-oxononadienedioate/2-hydroxy-6-oxononatrienedioate hydrolase [Tissierella praeacuta]